MQMESKEGISQEPTLKGATSQESTTQKVKPQVTWTTERLIIQSLMKQDIPFLGELLMDPTVTKYLEKHPLEFPTARDAMIHIAKNSEKEITFTVKLKDTNEIIGCIGYTSFSGEMNVSYWLGSKYQNKGYASEACLEFFNHIFESNSTFNKLVIEFNLLNLPSQKMAYKIRDFIANKHPEYRCLKDVDSKDEIKVEKVSDSVINLSIRNIDNFFSLSFFKKKLGFIFRSSFPEELAKEGTKIQVSTRTVTISKV